MVNYCNHTRKAKFSNDYIKHFWNIQSMCINVSTSWKVVLIELQGNLILNFNEELQYTIQGSIIRIRDWTKQQSHSSQNLNWHVEFFHSLYRKLPQ